MRWRHPPTDDTARAATDRRLLRRLWPYVRPMRGWLGLALLLTFPVMVFQVLQPVLLKIAIDDHILQADASGLGLIALAYLGMLCAEQGLAFAQIYLLQWVGQRSIQRVQEDLHAHVLTLDQRFYDHSPVGGLVTRMTADVEALNELLASGAISIVTDVFVLAGIAVMMFLTDVTLALLSLATVPVFLAASALYGRLLRGAQRTVRKRLGELNGRLEEDLEGREIVHLFDRADDRAEGFREKNDAYFDANRQAIRYDAQLFAVVEGISAAAIAVVLWYGAYGIAGGLLQFGVLKMFMQYILRFFVPLRDMSAKFAIIQSAMAAAERTVSLLGKRSGVQPPDDPQPLPALRDAIRFEGVSFAYDGRHPVLRDVSFRIRQGERVALVGATGAGKSTVVKLLTRQYDPTEGRVSWDDTDLRDAAPDAIVGRAAIVPQDVFLFADTVRENVRLGDPRVDDEAVERAVRAVGAEDFVRRLEGGYDQPLDARGGSLSSGEKQLLTYARALARDPEVLLLDEATSNVDSETERAIERATAVLLKGRTAVVIAHRLSTIRSVDRILVFHHGRLAEQGRHEELLAAGGLYAALHELQQRPIDYGATLPRDA